MTEPLDPTSLDPTVLDRADEADVQEQAQSATDTEESASVSKASTSDEVDDFDAAEQSRVVDLDQEEYR